jgi:hypothetical protein
MGAPYEDGTINPSLPLLQKSHLSWPIRPGTAPRRSSIRADASAGVASAGFALQLTLGLVPKLRLMALATAVLLPEFVGAASYSVLCFVGMLFHIIVLPAFSSRRIRPTRWPIEGWKELPSIKNKVILDTAVTKNMYGEQTKFQE